MTARPFPDTQLVETCPTLDIHALKRAGLLRNGAQGELRFSNPEITFQPGPYLPLRQNGGKLEVGGQVIALRSHPVAVWCFICPKCARGCYRLHLVDGWWRCRTCNLLQHACRHRQRGETARFNLLIQRLRKRVGTERFLGSDIPTPRRRSRRWKLIGLRILLLEERMVEMQWPFIARMRRRAQRRAGEPAHTETERGQSLNP
jgi:hypothetical protein